MRRSSLSLALSLPLCLSAACTAGDGSPGPTDRAAARATCERYVACVADAMPTALPAVLETYGSDGVCWDTQDNAALCGEACDAGIVDIRLVSPMSEACHPVLPATEARDLIGDESGWSLSARTTEDQCGLGRLFEIGGMYGSTYLYRFDAEVAAGDGLTFTLPLEPNQGDPFPIACAIEGQDFACEGTDGTLDYVATGTFNAAFVIFEMRLAVDGCPTEWEVFGDRTW